MRRVDADEFERLLEDFENEALHLETRDSYGTAVELPYLAKWLAGEPDDLGWLEGWCRTLRSHVKAGRSVKRARIISEPLSDYQRWSHSIAAPMVEAGEDIRWIPRRLVSTVAIPGNDFYLFDDRLAVFLHYTGNGLSAGMAATEDRGVVNLCRSAFQAVWRFSVPHSEYCPV